uniref:TF-B3 domain-containing protein n=1 Tax=Kalanchoe fedtschenkoi TaxID=63787 RepID=A0A7N0VHU0_KALFE
MKRNSDMTSLDHVEANCGSKKRLQTGATDNPGMAAKKEKAFKPRKQKEKINNGPNPPSGIPIAFKNAIQELGGTDWRLIIQKGLHETDLSSSHNRLSMPSKQCLTTAHDCLATMFDENGGDNNNICFPLIDTNFKVWESVTLRRWNMNKTIFVLAGDWNKLAAANNLRVQDVVQIWCFTFTHTGKHGLAMVKIEAAANSHTPSIMCNNYSSVAPPAASTDSHIFNSSAASHDGPYQSHSFTTYFDIWKTESSTSMMTQDNGSRTPGEGRMFKVSSTESNLSELAGNSSCAQCIDFWKTESMARDRTQVPSTQSHVTSPDIDLSLHL